jgi:hypothetical protein
MPNLVNRPKEGAAAPPEGTVTITHNRQAADDFMKALATVTAMIPLLEPADAAELDFVRTHQNVPIEFVKTAIAGIEQTPELQSFKDLDPAISLEMLQFLDAFNPVFDHVKVFADNLKFTLEWKVATLSTGALQSYHLIKGVARGRRSASAVALLANLKRALGLRANPKTAVAKAKAAAEAASKATPPKTDGAPVTPPAKPATDAAHITTAVPPKEVKA